MRPPVDEIFKINEELIIAIKSVSSWDRDIQLITTTNNTPC